MDLYFVRAFRREHYLAANTTEAQAIGTGKRKDVKQRTNQFSQIKEYFYCQHVPRAENAA